jgi:hypothetical protein
MTSISSPKFVFESVVVLNPWGNQLVAPRIQDDHG